MKSRIFLLSLSLFLLVSPLLYAQRSNVSVEAELGNNETFGFFCGTRVKGLIDMPGDFQMQAALRYLSFPRAVVDLRPAYVFELPFGDLAIEALAQYAVQNSTADVCAGVGASLRRPYFWLDLGTYYRQFSPVDGSSVLREPFNLMYELGVSFLPYNKEWDVFAVFTTKRLASLERFYSPSLVLSTAYSPLDNLSFVFSFETKSAGIFNIARVTYQSLASIGVKYIW